MELTPRLVPWISWEEWRSVHSALFDSAPATRQWGLEAVALWRARGRLPHAIDSTASLIEVVLWDSDSSSFRSVNELRLQYSMVIIRAVNGAFFLSDQAALVATTFTTCIHFVPGLVDPSQQSFFADSVLTLATRIDIPAWIVELRHDATHNALPNLSVLRSAANHMLGWLEQHYWNQQLVHLESLSSLCLPKSERRRVLRDKSDEDAAVSVSFKDCCPSLLLDLLLTPFLDTILQSIPPLRTSLSAQAKRFSSSMKAQRRQWLGTIKSACRDVPGFAISLIIRILLSAVDLLVAQEHAIRCQNSNSSSSTSRMRGISFQKVLTVEKLQWRLQVGCYWISLLSRECLVTSMGSIQISRMLGYQVMNDDLLCIWNSYLLLIFYFTSRLSLWQIEF